MIRTTAALLLSWNLCFALEQPLRFVDGEKAADDSTSVAVQRGADGPVLVTHLTTETHGRPYLHPLRSPNGMGVLTEFSPGHHKHQTGLYWGPTRINGRDYFHNYKKDYWANSKVHKPPHRKAEDPICWMSSSDLLDADSKPVLKETQNWSMKDHGTWYTLDLHWTGETQVDVTIGKYAYGGLFLRMPWRNGVPAECVNSEGQKNQAGEGQPAKWVDLAMKIEGMDEMAHIAILDHPANAGYPTLWRIDGQFGIGPAIARRGDVVIPKGTKASYRYRLVVYQGDFDDILVKDEAEEFATR